MFELKPEAERDAANAEKAADRMLKGAALIGLAGAIVGAGLDTAVTLSFWPSLAVVILTVAAGVFMVTFAGPLVTFAFVAFDPTNSMEGLSPWIRSAIGLVFAAVFAVVVTVMFFGALNHRATMGNTHDDSAAPFRD